MALPDDSYIIVFDELSSERREVAHALIKEKANGWWHNMPNIWIVGGHTSVYWRNELKPVIVGTNAAILVMRLPKELPLRDWAYFGPKAEARTRWLDETYGGVEKKKKKKAPAQPDLLS